MDFSLVSVTPPLALMHVGEWFGLALTFLIFEGMARPKENRVTGPRILIMILVSLGVLFPISTVATLLLAHNAIAFRYWYTSAIKAERPTVLACFSLFLLFHLLIFSGTLDSYLLHAYVPAWGRFILNDLAQFLRGSVSAIFILRFICVYAFGQSVLADSRVFDPPNPNELTHPFRDY
jgi:hypothetical protein